LQGTARDSRGYMIDGFGFNFEERFAGQSARGF
jgi:hypothetical protein